VRLNGEWIVMPDNTNGLCRSFAEGFRADDVDWNTRVRLNGEWIVVPDNTVVTEEHRSEGN
jgi:hypothetical protein